MHIHAQAMTDAVDEVLRSLLSDRRPVQVLAGHQAYRVEVAWLARLTTSYTLRNFSVGCPTKTVRVTSEW